MNKIVTSLAPHMTGMMVAAMMLALSLSVFLARWWQAILYNPGGFRREFHGLRLGRNVGIVALGTLAVSVAASGWSQEIAANAMIVIVAAYLLHGLGLVHGIVAAKNINVGWLISVYAVTLILPQSSLLLAAVAFADSWTDIRGRIKPGGQAGGDT